MRSNNNDNYPLAESPKELTSVIFEEWKLRYEPKESILRQRTFLLLPIPKNPGNTNLEKDVEQRIPKRGRFRS